MHKGVYFAQLPCKRQPKCRPNCDMHWCKVVQLTGRYIYVPTTQDYIQLTWYLRAARATKMLTNASKTEESFGDIVQGKLIFSSYDTIQM